MTKQTYHPAGTSFVILENREKEAHAALASALRGLARAEVEAGAQGRDPGADSAVKEAREHLASKQEEAIEASCTLARLQLELEAHKAEGAGDPPLRRRKALIHSKD